MFSPSSSGGSGSSVFSAYVNGRVPYEVYWESSPNPGFALYAGVSRFHRPFLIGAAHLVTCWKGSRRAYSECGETGNLDAAPALAGIWAEVAIFTVIQRWGSRLRIQLRVAFRGESPEAEFPGRPHGGFPGKFPPPRDMHCPETPRGFPGCASDFPGNRASINRNLTPFISDRSLRADPTMWLRAGNVAEMTQIPIFPSLGSHLWVPLECKARATIRPEDYVCQFACPAARRIFRESP